MTATLTRIDTTVRRNLSPQQMAACNAAVDSLAGAPAPAPLAGPLGPDPGGCAAAFRTHAERRRVGHLFHLILAPTMADDCLSSIEGAEYMPEPSTVLVDEDTGARSMLFRDENGAEYVIEVRPV